MDSLSIIRRYYVPGSRSYDILIRHRRQVAEKAVALAARVSDMKPDMDFVYQAAMLHDIGICRTHTPQLGCYGKQPYVCHGVIGRQMLETMGLARHALVCERHVGVGISTADIGSQHLPLPRRDMRPKTVEETIVCYADKFYSKDGDRAGKEKSVPEIIAKLEKYGSEKVRRFESWVARFGE